MSEITEQKETAEKIQNLKPFEYYKDLKPFEYYNGETREARNDAYLVAIAQSSKSHNTADAEAQRQGYSTDMARQARLMHILFKNFERSKWGHLVTSNLPYTYMNGGLDSLTRTFSCTWGISTDQSRRENIGTLKIKRYPDSPIMFWDFSLLNDEDHIVFSSSKMGTETFIDKQYLTHRFWCTPAHASIDLPSRGTTIEFCDDKNVSSVTINRLINVREDNGLYKWTRKFIEADGQLSFTREFIPHHSHEERTKAVYRAIPSLDLSASKIWWGLYLTTEVIKDAEDRNTTFLHTFTTKYEVPSLLRNSNEPALSQSQNGYTYGHKRNFGTNNNPDAPLTEILSTVQLLKADAPELYAHSTFKPTSKSLDDIYLDIYDQSPKTLNSYKTIMRMLDLNRTDGTIYRIKNAVNNRDYNMLVEAK